MLNDMDSDVLGKRILQDLKNVFKKDPLIDEFDILPSCESIFNKCPVIHIEHKVALENWCVKHVYIYAYSNLMKWKQNNNKIDYDTLLSWTFAVLLINPEVVTAWNVRKELLIQKVQQPIDELKFSEVVLSRKPKSSQVLAHRKWVLLQLQKSKPSLCTFQEVIEYELVLCSKIAERYPNNYYAWSHRMWVLQEILNICLKVVSEELQRMEHWVSTHISDYSGFHYRQFLLSCFSNAEFTNSKQFRNCFTCPIHTNLAQECECIKCRACNSDETESWHAFCYHNILEKELTLITELQMAYPGHEALWNHRRFVIHECNRAKSSPSACLMKSSSLESANSDSVIQCKRYKREISCCTTFDWNSSQEENFISQCLDNVRNDEWEKKLIIKHITWMQKVMAWSQQLLETS